MLGNSGNCLLIQRLVIPGFFRKDPGLKSSVGEGLDPGGTGSTGNHSRWIPVLRDEEERWEFKNRSSSTCPVLHRKNFIWPRFSSHFGKKRGKMGTLGDSSSSEGLQAGLGQADLADRSWSDPGAWSSSSWWLSATAAGSWHGKHELQVGCSWKSSLWQMASLCGISRGSFLPVFHRQLQPSAFNFTQDWRVIFKKSFLVSFQCIYLL